MSVTHAAALLDVVGRDYRKYSAAEPRGRLQLRAHYTGHTYAEIGKSDQPLPQLRLDHDELGR